jgi:CrcB protein
MLGALLRYGVYNGMGKLGWTGFPYATVSVNVIGSCVMGMLAGAAMHKFDMNEELRALLFIGLLGSFTTFSTFSLDVITLVQRDQSMSALLYIVASVTLSILGLAIGMSMMRGS